MEVKTCTGGRSPENMWVPSEIIYGLATIALIIRRNRYKG